MARAPDPRGVRGPELYAAEQSLLGGEELFLLFRRPRRFFAAAAVRDANDLTNELLTANAANLRQSNKAIREEMERGVFDIEAVKQANADLIGTIQESLQIADEGKAKRAAAEADLVKMEAELRDTLAAAKAKATGLGDAAGGAVPG